MTNFFSTHVPPIIYYLCAFSLGITFHAYHPLLALSFCSLAVVMLLRYKKYSITIGILMAAAGCITHNTYNYLYEQAVSIVPNKATTITGVITDIQKTNHRLFKNLVVITISTIDGKKIPWFNPHQKIHFYANNLNHPEVDDSITLENITCKKPLPSSYRGHLMREQTIATAFISKLTPTRLSRPSFSYKRWIHNLKIAATQRATNALAPATKSLYASLFLGNKTFAQNCYESIKEHFKRWGLSHYLARSGLHLVLIVALWSWFFRTIPIPLLYKELLIALLVLIYATLSWSSISFIRALSTFFLCKVCSGIWHHYYHNLHLLSVTALYLLIQNPLHLFYLDFQLSFGITFALAWLHLLKTYQTKLESKTIASV